MLKFNLLPKLPVVVESTNDIKDAGLQTNNNNIANKEVKAAFGAKSRGGGAGYHYPNEECNGMLRLWDGPLREVPVCNDLNW